MASLVLALRSGNFRAKASLLPGLMAELKLRPSNHTCNSTGELLKTTHVAPPTYSMPRRRRRYLRRLLPSLSSSIESGSVKSYSM